MNNDINPAGNANQAEQSNPYAAPRTTNFEAPSNDARGQFVPGGRKVDASRGLAWITEAWPLFSQNIGLWIGMALVFFIGMFVLGRIPFLGSIASIASIVLSPIIVGGFMIAARKADRGKEVQFEDMFAGFKKNPGQLALIGLLNLLLVAAVIVALTILVFIGMAFGFGMAKEMRDAMAVSGLIGAMVAGFLFFLIFLVALIPILMAAYFAPALVLFHSLSAFEAMKQSFSGCIKNIGSFLVYGLVYFVAAIIATIPFGLGWFVLGPVMMISIYIAYKDIFLE